MLVKVKKLHPGAQVPKYATEGAACFDLHAVDTYPDTIVSPGTPRVVRTGLSFGVPANHVMLVYSRSGHGFKNNVRLSNCVGVIDADYTGEVMVRLTADTGGRLEIKEGDRIAQAMVIPVDRVEFEEVSELAETERGVGGFGSTGTA